MKRTFVLVLMCIIMLVLINGQSFEDSLVSDGFDSLSVKWNILEEGDGGSISFYDSTWTFENASTIYMLNDPGIHIKAIVNSTYSYGKYGVERFLPTIIKDKFSRGAIINMDIPAQTHIRTPDVVEQANFTFEIEFEDNRILKYIVSTIDYLLTSKTTVTCIFDNSIVLDTTLIVIKTKQSQVEIEPIMYLNLYLLYKGDSIYTIFGGKEIKITSKPNVIRMYGYIESGRINLLDYYATRVGGLYCYPDLDDLMRVEYLPQALYYEQDNTLTVTATNYYSGESFGDYARVTILNHNYEIVYGPANTDNTTGTIDIPLHPIEGDSLYYYMIVENTSYKGQVDTFKIPIKAYTMYVELEKEIPVLKDNEYEVYVYELYEDLPSVPPIEAPIEGAYVKIDNGLDILKEGYTDNNGIVVFPINTSYTKELNIFVDKDGGYKAKEEITYPYMWTTDRWANEGNNKSRISRKPNTEQLYMVYSDGDRIIGCESFNYGKYWGLNVLGEGKDPVMVRMGDSIIVVWKVDEYNLAYVIKSSPWEAPSYLPPVMTSSEFVMTRDPMKSNIWGGYLVKRYLNQEGADYVFMKWDDIGNSDIIDTMIVVPYTGDEKNIVPDRNPVTSHYETPLSGGTQPLIGFIDTTNIYRGKMWDEYKMNWLDLFSISDESKYANHASIDGYGTKTVFVWEEWEGGLSKIASRIMENGVMGDIEYITDYGNNTNPKTKGGAVYAWESNNKTIKTDKEMLGNKTGIVYSSNDSISGMDFDLLPYEFDNKFLVKAYYTWIEGNNGEYRIKGKSVSYTNDIVPLYTILPSSETIIKSEESVLSEYVRGNRDIEEYKYISSGVDNQKYYKGIITLEGNNPTIPIGILLEDGSVEYVYVRGNERVIKEIDIPQGTYEDKEIEIKIQRVKGNPKRDIKVELKEYERLSEESIEIANTNNRELLMDKIYESKSSGIINNIVSGELKYGISKKGKVSISIYDISGRCVMEKEESILEAGIYRERINFLKKGVYFVIIETEEESIKEKIIVIK